MIRDAGHVQCRPLHAEPAVGRQAKPPPYVRLAAVEAVEQPPDPGDVVALDELCDVRASRVNDVIICDDDRLIAEGQHRSRRDRVAQQGDRHGVTRALYQRVQAAAPIEQREQWHPFADEELRLGWDARRGGRPLINSVGQRRIVTCWRAGRRSKYGTGSGQRLASPLLPAGRRPAWSACCSRSAPTGGSPLLPTCALRSIAMRGRPP
jgi:hypothetical protein